MKRRILLAGFIAVISCGCTQKNTVGFAYNMVQMYQQDRCNEKAEPLQEDCRKQHAASYEEYQERLERAHEERRKDEIRRRLEEQDGG